MYPGSSGRIRIDDDNADGHFRQLEGDPVRTWAKREPGGLPYQSSV